MEEHFGLYFPDRCENWSDWIEQKKETSVWIDGEWELMDDDSDDGEMDELQKRAIASIKVHKRPFDKHERRIRSENVNWPLWVSRIWFYLATFDDSRAEQIVKLETNLKRQVRDKKRKKDRDKLFKRLGVKRRR